MRDVSAHARTRREIAQRAGHVCAFPGCPRTTSAANDDGTGSVDLGIAAHITAAAPGGPRFDASLTCDARRVPENGLWMCKIHADLIDRDEPAYPTVTLHEWRGASYRDARERAFSAPALLTRQIPSGAFASLLSAAAEDLSVMRRLLHMTSAPVERTLKVDGTEGTGMGRQTLVLLPC